MRALRLESFGPATGLSVKEVAKPHTAPGQVLVEIWGAGLNPSDVGNVSGNFKQTTLPRTPGRDLAGIVVEGGGSLAGAEVWCTGGPLGFTMDGAHAEYVLLPESAVRHKPESLTLEQAGAIGVPYVTAWSALVTAGKLQAGETVLIVGASGAVGRAAAQIARWRGAQVIGADRQGNAEINTAKEDLRQGLARIKGDAGVNLVFDTVGGALFETSLSCLAYRGRLVSISSKGQPRVSFDLVHFYHQELSLYGVDSLKLDLDSSAQILDQLAPGFNSGSLTPPDVHPLPLTYAVEAYQSLAEGKTPGKMILAPQSA